MEEVLSKTVSEPWLYYIQIGKKKIEGRAGDVKSYYYDWIGKRVYFYNEDRKIPVIIRQIRHYNSLEEYVDGEGIENVAPHLNDRDEVISEYSKFYSKKVVDEKGGMLALEIELL